MTYYLDMSRVPQVKNRRLKYLQSVKSVKSSFTILNLSMPNLVQRIFVQISSFFSTLEQKWKQHWRIEITNAWSHVTQLFDQAQFCKFCRTIFCVLSPMQIILYQISILNNCLLISLEPHTHDKIWCVIEYVMIV